MLIKIITITKSTWFEKKKMLSDTELFWYAGKTQQPPKYFYLLATEK